MTAYIVIDADNVVQRIPIADESLQLRVGESLVTVPREMLVPPRQNDAAVLVWLIDALVWADKRSIDQVRAAQMAILESAYAISISQPVTYTSRAGVSAQYQADASSVSNVANMQLAFAGAGATPVGFYWLASDNTQIPFSYADIQGLAATLGRQGFSAFQILQTKKTAVRAATTAAAVAAITWP